MNRTAIERENSPSVVDGVFFGTCLFGLVAFHVYHHAWVLITCVAGLLGVSQLAQSFSKIKPAAFVILVSYLMLVGTAALGVLNTWPIDIFLIFLIARVSTAQLFGVDFSARWNFRFTRSEWASMALILIPSIGCLLWYYLRFPEVAARFPLPEVPRWGLPFLILLAAAINGLREELLYRSVIQRAFLNGLAVPCALVLQALAFGFLHFNGGFPQGWIGVALTSLFGLAIGIQYFVFRSITLTRLRMPLCLR